MRSPELAVSAAVLAAVAIAGCSNNNHAGMPGMNNTPASTSAAASTPAAGSGTPAAVDVDGAYRFGRHGGGVPTVRFVEPTADDGAAAATGEHLDLGDVAAEHLLAGVTAAGC